MLHANNRKDSEVIPSGSFQESIFRSPASSCSQRGCPSWKIKGSGVPCSMPSKVWLLPLTILWFKLGCPFSSLLKCTDYLLGWDFEQRPIIRVASEWPPSGCNRWTTVLTSLRKKSIHKWKFYASPLLSGASQVAPVVKNPPANEEHKRHRFDPRVGGSPWSRKWQRNSVFLPGKSHRGKEGPGGLWFIRLQSRILLKRL